MLLTQMELPQPLSLCPSLAYPVESSQFFAGQLKCHSSPETLPSVPFFPQHTWILFKSLNKLNTELLSSTNLTNHCHYLNTFLTCEFLAYESLSPSHFPYKRN